SLSLSLSLSFYPLPPSPLSSLSHTFFKSARGGEFLPYLTDTRLSLLPRRRSPPAPLPSPPLPSPLPNRRALDVEVTLSGLSPSPLLITAPGRDARAAAGRAARRRSAGPAEPAGRARRVRGALAAGRPAAGGAGARRRRCGRC
ncbi:AP-1 complex subunit gamma-1, partial [Frankliniella fusca]